MEHVSLYSPILESSSHSKLAHEGHRYSTPGRDKKKKITPLSITVSWVNTSHSVLVGFCLHHSNQLTAVVERGGAGGRRSRGWRGGGRLYLEHAACSCTLARGSWEYLRRWRRRSPYRSVAFCPKRLQGKGKCDQCCFGEVRKFALIASCHPT